MICLEAVIGLFASTFADVAGDGLYSTMGQQLEMLQYFKPISLYYLFHICVPWNVGCNLILRHKPQPALCVSATVWQLLYGAYAGILQTALAS